MPYGRAALQHKDANDEDETMSDALEELPDAVAAAAFRRLRNAGRTLTAGRISQVVREALRETFDVFEGYAE